MTGSNHSENNEGLSAAYLELYRRFDAPYENFDNSMLGPGFPEELETVSRLWFACGYWPGIASYLNFFLLKDFIETHDKAFPPRFRSFRSMAESFYQTDLFIRDVTDSGLKPTGGISSQAVRADLKKIMVRHERIAIPGWRMTYFGFSLLEMVEKKSGALLPEDKMRHLSYMSKTYRIMGLAFTENREALEQFARLIEEAHAGLSPDLEKHTRNILVLGEMAKVSSRYDELEYLLPKRTKKIFGEIYARVRLSPLKRWGAGIAGRLLLKQAIGRPRKPVPVMD